MVPGHAIYQGTDLVQAQEDESWILEPYQRGGSINTFIKHITKGVELAVRDSSSLLIFS